MVKISGVKQIAYQKTTLKLLRQSLLWEDSLYIKKLKHWCENGFQFFSREAENLPILSWSKSSSISQALSRFHDNVLKEGY